MELVTQFGCALCHRIWFSCGRFGINVIVGVVVSVDGSSNINSKYPLKLLVPEGGEQPRANKQKGVLALLDAVPLPLLHTLPHARVPKTPPGVTLLQLPAPTTLPLALTVTPEG
jgi:hypothetical protein